MRVKVGDFLVLRLINPVLFQKDAVDRLQVFAELFLECFLFGLAFSLAASSRFLRARRFQFVAVLLDGRDCRLKLRPVARTVGEGEGAKHPLTFFPFGQPKDVEREFVEQRLLPIGDIGGNRREVPDRVLDVRCPSAGAGR